MHALTLIISLFAVAPIAFGAPVQVLDENTFTENGRTAQEFNAGFAATKASDACDEGQFGCVDGANAVCTKGKWELTPCPRKDESCFAIPNFVESGASIVCTTEAMALNIIEATGVEGGITGDLEDCDDEEDDDNDNDDNKKDDNNATSTSASATGSRSSSSASKSASATSSAASSSATTNGNSTSTASNGSVVVTITVTELDPPSQTLTLNASEASSLLSSLSADKSISVTTVINPARPTVTGTSTSSTINLNAASTILLNSPSSTSQSSTAAPTMTVPGPNRQEYPF